MNIKAVAKAAGVSVATISRVLNHPEQVQPETKSHVLAVMEALNYQPNWFARGLNLGRTNTIALLVPNIENRRFLNIMTGVETVALKKQHTVFLCNTHADLQEESDYLRMVMDRRVDGVILVSTQQQDKVIPDLSGGSFPLVHIGRSAPRGCGNLCFINYEEGAYQMTCHLISLGHPTIALLLDAAPLSEMQMIAAGYRRAMAEKLPHAPEQILYGEDSVQGGYLTAQKLLQSRALPRAILAASDEQAFGIMKAAADNQLEIPRDLALACLIDSPMCSIVSPALTSLELPSKRLGMVAARILFDCIEGGEEEEATGGPQEVILQPKLKIRRSCGNTKHIYELFG